LPPYHGNTLLASRRPREHYRTIYGDWLVDVTHPRAVRLSLRLRSATVLPGMQWRVALEEAIVREDPETVAAFIAEPVGGSSTGARCRRRMYLPR
jgi:adenosylmethionine-8-amino-7-oxononanoate aminotransferase